jgi:hypothetical protein
VMISRVTCAILNSAPSHGFIRLHAMAIRKQAIHVICPACQWTETALAYEGKLARCCLCPHCQDVWGIPLTSKPPRKP